MKTLSEATPKLPKTEHRLGSPRRPLVQMGLMVIASATIGPASIYLDYTAMNPPLPGLLLVVATSTTILGVLVAILHWWRRDVAVGAMSGLVWIILTTSGRLLDRSDSGLLWVILLSASFLVIVVGVRAFRRQVIAWFLLASVLSLSATILQVGVSLSKSLRTIPLPLVDVIATRPTGSFYLIVVDGYGPLDHGSAESERMLDTFENHGFTVVTDAVANYTQTYTSISNMLTLSHHFKGGVSAPSTVFAAMQGAHVLRSHLERAGWKYMHVESDWTGTFCGPTVENCVPNGFFDGVVWEFALSTAFGSLIEDSVTHPHVSQGLRSMESVATHAFKTDSGSDFVFAHVLLPHPPLQLRANCEISIDPRVGGQHYRFHETNEEIMRLRTDRYLEQRSCLNLKITEVLGALPPEASVVITSDHGPDLRGQLDKPPLIWDASDIAERFPILHATRLPAGCVLTTGMI